LLAVAVDVATRSPAALRPGADLVVLGQASPRRRRGTPATGAWAARPRPVLAKRGGPQAM